VYQSGKLVEIKTVNDGDAVNLMAEVGGDEVDIVLLKQK
jgi:hypothetical protein